MSNETLLLATLSSIQEIIKRMASNSLFIKGWSMSLTGVIIALAKKDYTPESIEKIGMLIIIFNILFSLLDSYYLKQERIFRNEYNKKIGALANKTDTDTLTIISRKQVKTNFLNIISSVSIMPFYLVMLAIGVFVMFGGII